VVASTTAQEFFNAEISVSNSALTHEVVALEKAERRGIEPSGTCAPLPKAIYKIAESAKTRTTFQLKSWKVSIITQEIHLDYETKTMKRFAC